MATWKDKQQSYTNKTVVASEIQYGIFNICIHHHIHYEPDDWLVTCHELAIKKLLKSKDLNDAKKEVEVMIKEILDNAIKDISND